MGSFFNRYFLRTFLQVIEKSGDRVPLAGSARVCPGAEGDVCGVHKRSGELPRCSVLPRLLPGCYYVTRLEHLAWLPEGKNWPSRLVLPCRVDVAPPSADLWLWTRTGVGFPLCWEQGRWSPERLTRLSPGEHQEVLCPCPAPCRPPGRCRLHPLPTSRRPTTPDMGYTEGLLVLALKGSCFLSLPRPPLLPAARTHSPF